MPFAATKLSPDEFQIMNLAGNYFCARDILSSERRERSAGAAVAAFLGKFAAVVQAKWRTEVRRYEGHVKCARLKAGRNDGQVNV